MGRDDNVPRFPRGRFRAPRPSVAEELEAPHSVGGDVHFYVFAEVLVSASSLVLEPGRESTR